MKATRAWLKGPRNLVFEDVDVAVPGPRDITASTKYSALSSGTEVAAWVGLEPLHRGQAYPRLVGYCNVARVTAVGNEVTGVSVGDLVLTHQSHCSAFTCSEKEVLLKVPAVAARAATMLYLVQLALAALKRSEVTAQDTVLVQGLGVLGLSAVKLAHSFGCQVIAVGNDERRLQLASTYGADSIAGPNDALDGVADVVVSTVNGWGALRQAMTAARPHARIALLGFPGRGEGPPSTNPLDPVLFYRKQLSLLSSGYASDRRWGGGDTEGALRANLGWLLERLLRGKLEVDSLISTQVDARELPAMYEALATRNKSHLGVVLTWPEEKS